MMIFVTDCDNTLVHYDTSKKHNTAVGSVASNGDTYTEHDLITLPASSGSGKVATVSARTLSTLNEIEAESVEIICATGMRASTMFQREKFFPSIKYWACENGGRIYHRGKEDGQLSEIVEYGELFEQRTECKKDLETFADLLRVEGWDVDSTGYLTMVRVRGQNFHTIVDRIPPTLSHTFNLGHLDIQYTGCGKLAAVQWIIENRLSDLSKSGKTVGARGTPYFFMGDDDNDIEIASASTVAFITKPCSTAMQTFIDDFNSQNGEKKSHNLKHIFEAPFLRHLGTEAMLALVLDMAKSEKASPQSLRK